MKKETLEEVLLLLEKNNSLHFSDRQALIVYFLKRIEHYIDWLEDIKMISGTPEHLIQLLLSNIVINFSWIDFCVYDSGESAQSFILAQLKQNYLQHKTALTQTQEKDFIIVCLLLAIELVRIHENKENHSQCTIYVDQSCGWCSGINGSSH